MQITQRTQQEIILILIENMWLAKLSNRGLDENDTMNKPDGYIFYFVHIIKIIAIYFGNSCCESHALGIKHALTPST